MPLNIFNGSFTQFRGSLNVGPFTPSAAAGGGGGSIVTTNLTHHFDAGDAASYTGTGTTWTNLVGNGYNLGLINTPTFVSNGASSYFVFNGVDEWASGSGYLGAAADRRTFTLNIVLNFAPFTSHGSRQKFFADAQNPTTIYVTSNFGSSLNDWESLEFSAGATNFFVDIIPFDGGYAYSASRNCMMTIVSSPTKVDAYINGTFISSSTEPFTATNTMNSATRDFGFAIGDTRADFLSMSIAHIMFYSSSLSAADVTQNYNALKSRYGI